METYYLWPILTVLTILGLSYRNRSSLDSEKFAEIALLSILTVQVGLGSLWAFLGHAFMPDVIATYIGWPTGSPFQLEVAFANLSFGVMGLLSWKFRGEFWMATIIGFSVFYLGAAYGHIMDALINLNYSPGNIGAPLYIDIVIPLLLLLLLVYHRKFSRKSQG